MVEVNRRGFLAGAGLAAGGAFAAPEEKTADGGFAPVSWPGKPERPHPVLPPGAGGDENYLSKCVECSLCVQRCPNGVLRVRPGGRGLHPEMGFDRGWCRPECTACGEACPAGAIRKVTPERKAMIRVGHAIWKKDLCLAASEGVPCDACAKHCPAGAIHMMQTAAGAPKTPVIDTLVCRGCGACEHLCPARPMPAMVVKGFVKHRETKPMGEQDLLDEVRGLFAKNKAAVVAVRDGVIVAGAKGRGLSPLLDLCERDPAKVKGAWIIDKVIGKAAAAICVTYGAERVHAALMCEEGKKLLEAHGIKNSADKLVPRILNRERNGLCPLEASVDKVEKVPEMMKALKAKLAELRSGAGAPPPPPEKKQNL